eukprot:gnl/TRDRNA2_/TRDRNA2_168422_c0_seq2.p1 gnl/TRDRNA2_/TRDRNA2_168422_c0~~gnl/TRDRNA2_/TRDRNA2_168422_c0_seq2.p1  ORF type:complete len:343 (+),score=46.11 gnl/TRDRNA2_/TRDRNA2_168422_c0_seq2:76-1029(+)
MSHRELDAADRPQFPAPLDHEERSPLQIPASASDCPPAAPNVEDPLPSSRSSLPSSRWMKERRPSLGRREECLWHPIDLLAESYPEQYSTERRAVGYVPSLAQIKVMTTALRDSDSESRNSSNPPAEGRRSLTSAWRRKSSRCSSRCSSERGSSTGSPRRRFSRRLSDASFVSNRSASIGSEISNPAFELPAWLAEPSRPSRGHKESKSPVADGSSDSGFSDVSGAERAGSKEDPADSSDDAGFSDVSSVGSAAPGGKQAELATGARLVCGGTPAAGAGPKPMPPGGTKPKPKIDESSDSGFSDVSSVGESAGKRKK